jgi:CcmD family protein
MITAAAVGAMAAAGAAGAAGAPGALGPSGGIGWVAVTNVLIWTGLFLYLLRLHRKVRELEKGS